MATAGTANIPLEVLLSSPIFWRSKKCRWFIHETHNSIQDKTDKETNNFRSTLNEHQLWGDNGWDASFNREVLRIFTTMYTYKNRTVSTRRLPYDNQSVLSLLASIRNKSEHFHLLSDNEKITTGWFQRKISTRNVEQLKFCEQYYVQFWAEMFPELFLFLWCAFQPMLKDDKEYYIPKCNIYTKQFYLCLKNFPVAIYSALGADLNKGALEDRFWFEKPTGTTLEFRTTSTSLVGSILNRAKFADFSVNSIGVLSKWYGKENGSVGVVDERKNSAPFSDHSLEPFFIVIARSITELVTNHLIKIFTGKNVPVRIIVLTSRSHKLSKREKEEFVEKLGSVLHSGFVERPILCSELDSNTSNLIFKNGQVKIQAKQRVAKITEIFCEGLRKDLQGSTLNALLKDTKAVPTLFKAPEILKVETEYLSRDLIDLRRLTSDVFRTISNRNILLVVGIDKKKLQKEIGSDIEITESESLSVVTNFIVMEHAQVLLLCRTYENIRQEFENLNSEHIFSEKSIHCLKYQNGNIFHWIYSHGTVDYAIDAITESARLAGKISESEFLKHIDEQGNSLNFITVADKSGMGKSYYFAKIADKILKMDDKNYKTRLVGYIEVREFVRGFDIQDFDKLNEFITKELVLKHIIEIYCNYSDERQIARKWLQIENPDGFKFELFMDGLDEVDSQYESAALQILQIIQTEFSSMRVWIASREHTLNRIKDTFGCLGYKFAPFTKENQISFLERQWKKAYIASGNNLYDVPTDDELREFAEKCITVLDSIEENEIAGIPLQCHIISEIYQENVIEKRLNVNIMENESLLTLYEKMLRKKMDIFLSKLRQLESDNILASLVKTNINNILVYFAIQAIFSEKVAKLFESRLVSVKKSKAEKIAKAHGIIQSTCPVKFHHRSVAEFIVARFVYQVLIKQHTNVAPELKEFKEFYNDHVLRNGVFYFKWRWEMRYPVLNQFLKAFLKSCNSARVPRVLPKLPSENVTDEFFELLKFRESYYSNKSNDQLDDSVIRTFSNRNFLIFPLASEKYRAEILFMCLQNPLGFGMAEYLLDNFADLKPVNWKNLQSFGAHKNSLLHWILFGLSNNNYNRNEQKAKLFLKQLVDKSPEVLEQKDSKGRTALGWLTSQWSNDNFDKFGIRIHEYFVSELGSDLRALDNNSNTVLHLAANPRTRYVHRFIELLNFFLKKEVSRELVNRTNKNNETPLVKAILEYRDKLPDSICKIFMNCGANFNVQDKTGNTILHYAVIYKAQLSCIKELVQCGSNISIVNNNGKTPLQISEETNRSNVTMYLQNVEKAEPKGSNFDYCGKAKLVVAVIVGVPACFMLLHGLSKARK